MEFVRLEYDNNKATNAELNGHQELITEVYRIYKDFINNSEGMQKILFTDG